MRRLITNYYGLKDYQIESFKKHYDDTSLEDLCILYSVNPIELRKLTKKIFGPDKPLKYKPLLRNDYNLSKDQVKEFIKAYPDNAIHDLQIKFKLTKSQVAGLKKKYKIERAKKTPIKNVKVKFCNKCKLTKSRDEFNIKTEASDGLQHNCRECSNKKPKPIIEKKTRVVKAPEWWIRGNKELLKKQAI